MRLPKLLLVLLTAAPPLSGCADDGASSPVPSASGEGADPADPAPDPDPPAAPAGGGEGEAALNVPPLTAEGEGEGEGDHGGAAGADGGGEGEGEGEGEHAADPPPAAVTYGPVPWHEGAYGTHWRDVVGPWRITTLEGRHDYELSWDGEHSYVFITYTDDPRQPAQLREFLDLLFFSPGAVGEFEELLRASPPDVRYVFASRDQDAGRDIIRIEELAVQALERLSPEEQDSWQGRLLFMATPLNRGSGWLADFLRSSRDLWWGIDRFQRLRLVGSVGDNRFQGRPRLLAFAKEAEYWHFERQMVGRLASQDAQEAPNDWTVVRVWDGDAFGHADTVIDLPDAEVMAGFDTLEVDLTAHCVNNLDERCGDWDRISNLSVCDLPLPLGEPNPRAEQACQPFVAAVLPPEGGEGEGEGEGEPPPAGSPEIPAETAQCDCIDAFGATVQATQTCNAEGTGFNDCPCGCSAEMARWITTYKREGRWVSDASPSLAFLTRGGPTRLRMAAGNHFVVTLDLRMSYQARPEGRPFKAERFFGGGGFGPSYNEGRAPYEFIPPAESTQTFLYALITGHGWGVTLENCAEFCNHTHHFQLNDHPQEFVRRHDLLDTEEGRASGCFDQVHAGVVPNQYGTWPFGRAGWCPGLDVFPWIVNLTPALLPAAEATPDNPNIATYRGLYAGRDYEPTPNPNPPGGFGANINMSSYLIHTRP